MNKSSAITSANELFALRWNYYHIQRVGGVLVNSN